MSYSSSGVESREVKKLVSNQVATVKYESSFRTSRKVAEGVSSFGWIIVAISILIMMISIVSALSEDRSFDLLAIFPAFGGVVTGILLVMNGQLTRASIDTADNTGKSLIILHELLKQKSV